MAWQDWVGLGAEAFDWWQSRKNASESTAAMNKGYKKAAKVAKAQLGPYSQWGQKHMKGYDNLGEFNFQFDQSDPSYQWRYNQGLQGVMRTQMGKRMARSGNTGIALEKYGQDMASQEYQAEFDRDYKSWQGNVDYHKFPIETGQLAASSLADTLGTIAIGQGNTNAALEETQGRINSGAIGDVAKILTGQGASPTQQVIGSAVKQAISKGLGGDDLLGWVADKTGLDLNNVTSVVKEAFGLAGGSAAGTAATMFGGGAASGMGTGIGAMSTAMTGESAMGITGMAEGFGGNFAAGLATPGSSVVGTATGTGAAWGSTSLAAFGTSVALGGAVLGGIALLNNMLGSDPEFGKMMNVITKKAQNGQDPLEYIASTQFNEKWRSDINSMVERDAATFGKDLQSGAARGMVYSTIINQMNDPQAITQLKQQPYADKMVRSMMDTVFSGATVDLKWAKSAGFGNYATDSLIKMFPHLETQIKRASGTASAARRASDTYETYDGGLHYDVAGRERETAAAAMAARVELQSLMAVELDKMRRQSLLANA